MWRHIPGRLRQVVSPQRRSTSLSPKQLTLQYAVYWPGSPNVSGHVTSSTPSPPPLITGFLGTFPNLSVVTVKLSFFSLHLLLVVYSSTHAQLWDRGTLDNREHGTMADDDSLNHDI